MVWDPDINPTGFTQKIELHKIFGFSGLELTVNSGQLILSDNNENLANTNGTERDAWMYVNQIVATVPVTEDIKLTVAPGFLCTNGALVTGDGGGEMNFLNGDQTYNRTNTNLDGLKLVTIPGDVSFKLAGKPSKFVWDFSKNLDGTDRSALYSNNAATFVPSDRDNLAWLVGFQFGENKKKGDWSVLANYRQVGLSAVDPNINDSDWALSYTNMAGYKAGFQYNLGDATTVSATYFQADNLRKNLGGGTTTYGPGSFKNSVNVLQLDLSVKF
jgi:hypothetical protein